MMKWYEKNRRRIAVIGLIVSILGLGLNLYVLDSGLDPVPAGITMFALGCALLSFIIWLVILSDSE